MENSGLKKLLLLICICFLSAQVSAQWQLDNDASSLHYVSSKASAVSEVNSFSELSGNIDSSGNALLAIELASVETSIEVRNQRVRDILFQVLDYPQANVSLNVDLEALENMPVGSSVAGEYSAELNLHGISEALSAELQITKLADNSLQVQLAKPLIVNASTYGLAQGVEELREIAGLPSINTNVVVDFTLLFVK